MYKTIVFDLDGTLLDTLDDLTEAVNAALKAYGLPLRSKEEVRSFIGNGIAKLMQRACGIENYPDQEGLLNAFKQYYAVHCADNTKAYDGVLAMLRTLREKGIKTAVLSNKADFAVKQLAKTYFDGLLCEAAGENEAAGIRKKPAPDALFSIMQNLGVSAEETLYVGDSEVDIQTANNAGVACVSVAWGFKDEDFLLRHGATKIARSAQELLALCLE